jgi:hypothetical protein
MSIARTPYPEPTLPVTTPAADPTARAFAQSGQTSRPVIVLSKGRARVVPARVALWWDQSSAYSTIDAAAAAPCHASNVAAAAATTMMSRLTVRMLGLP